MWFQLLLYCTTNITHAKKPGLAPSTRNYNSRKSSATKFSRTNSHSPNSTCCTINSFPQLAIAFPITVRMQPLCIRLRSRSETTQSRPPMKPRYLTFVRHIHPRTRRSVLFVFALRSYLCRRRLRCGSRRAHIRQFPRIGRTKWTPAIRRSTATMTSTPMRTPPTTQIRRTIRRSSSSNSDPTRAVRRRWFCCHNVPTTTPPPRRRVSTIQ